MVRCTWLPATACLPLTIRCCCLLPACPPTPRPRTPHSAVQSHAKVLGNGSLKFKYLNPNTLFVAVGTPAGAQHAEGAEGEEHLLGVMLLDAVTGRVLASQQHEVGGWALSEPGAVGWGGAWLAGSGGMLRQGGHWPGSGSRVLLLE